MIKGCNIFWGQKLANTCRFVSGHIIVQQEKFSRADCSWMNPLNALQEVIKGCNIFWGQKLANTCGFVGGCIIMQQEKILRAERSWTNPLNALQEVIHYSFYKILSLLFFPLVRILCALCHESQKKLSMCS